MRTNLPALVLGLLLCGSPALAESFLLAGDLVNEDNRMDLLFDDKGLIDFMSLTEYPGAGYMERTDLDVVPRDWMAHGPRIVPSELIARDGEGGWTVQGVHTFPALVRIDAASITMTLGDEAYRVSRPGNYLVEIRPRLADGTADRTRRFAYEVARNSRPGQGFLGIVDESYRPVYEFGKTENIDWIGVTYPRSFTMGGNSLEASTWYADTRREDPPDLEFKYTVAMGTDRETDLENYLILLTRRRPCPGLFIHPVLLTLLYFDALVK